VKSAYDDALAVLTSFAPTEPGQQLQRTEVLGYLHQHLDGLRRTCRPDHVTASAIVLSPDGARVMLGLHRKVGRWLQFGGHVEPEDTGLAEAALREAREESGVACLSLWAPEPVRIDIHPAPCGAQRHLDVQFLASCDLDTEPTASEESLDVGWFDVETLPAPSDLSVHDLVAEGRRRIRS
jgi:8-oxo-dGTP pyrophosphatase MutT (NUDIX family)